MSRHAGGQPVSTSRCRGESLSDLSGDHRYTIGHEIAKGGMGVVFQAYDQDVRRQVALKVLPDTSDPEQRARFVEEAQVTGQLEHPNIVPIHELGMDAQDRLFFSMKLLRGRTLGEALDLIREDPASGEALHPLPELVHALAHACDAIAFAHDRGVVHRDLKPGNIMLGDFGEVCVMDWGLAKVGAARPASAPAKCATSAPPPAEAAPRADHDREADFPRVATYRHDSSHFITVDGMVAGTPAYMAPEQARGDVGAIDERTDIYGLGAILYEILTLAPPVEGADDAACIRNAMTGRILAPEQRAPRRDFPRELSRTAMRALAYDPARRHPTAAVFKAELIRFLHAHTAEQTSEPFRTSALRLFRRHPGRTLLALFAVAGLLASAFLSLLH